MSTTELTAALARVGVSDVADSTLERAAYASDASLYRIVPACVVRPRDADEVAAVLAVANELAIGVTCRGAGTSIAGNAIGRGIVVDFSSHMRDVRHVDAERATAEVDPGVLHAQLQRAVAPHGLRFGPDPSTHTRCTIGGMIGNNACGSRALGYGRTVDNIVALDCLTASGRRLRLDGGALPEGPEIAATSELARRGASVIAEEFGRFGRQVSGYGLEHLLSRPGGDVRRLLAGSEGTLAVVVGATVALVAQPAHPVLLVLGYPDMASAADASVGLLEFSPTALEGFDARLVAAVTRQRGGRAPELPRGAGWLFVELVGEHADEALAMARRAAAVSGALDHAIVVDRHEAAGLFALREIGAALAGRTPDGAPAYPGWEDSAVPTESLGAYLRELELVLANYGLTGMPYGHFGSGCLHLRLDFPFNRPEGRTLFRDFATDAARLVARFGGSLSGEHGDGRARSELLPLMYSADALSLFADLKRAFDPTNLLNPGVLVDPDPIDADVRAIEAFGSPGLTAPIRLAMGITHDHGDFSAAVHRCTGVGVCRADTTASGGVMCPSYLATRREQDSTRGRARVLQEMVNGRLVSGGWRSPEVREALDLCLSCKACSSECPAGVDMATLKSEVLYQAHRGRVRPRSHYTLGRLPAMLRLAQRLPMLANAVLRSRLLAPVTRRVAGIDARRSLPAIASVSYRTSFAGRPAPLGGGAPVTLFLDCFTDHFAPHVAAAAVDVLERAGFSVSLTPRSSCCAITWITTGQLDRARRILKRTADDLASSAEPGVPIVGLEPSCLAALRSDLPELVDSDAARLVASRTITLAELLADAPGWEAPDLSGLEVLVQPHCHHRAALEWNKERELLAATGARVTEVGGCCGLAGNFGMEAGHYDVSVAVAEHDLLPAVRAAARGTEILADGFSCRTQLTHLAGVDSRHLVELLAESPAPRRPLTAIDREQA